MFIRSKLKYILRKSFSSIGLDIKRLSPLDSVNLRLHNLLTYLNISTIFDIGANSGQFALKLRELGYKSLIISFEPLSSAHLLLTNLSERDQLWTIYPRVAISDTSGARSLNISKNSVSSSLHTMLSNHLESAPESEYVGTETVNVETLNDVFSKLQTVLKTQTGGTLLKIDAQGHEFAILQGGSLILDKVSVILLELSVECMYENEKDMFFVAEWLKNHDFELWSISPTFYNKITGRILQYDGIFVKKT